MHRYEDAYDDAWTAPATEAVLETLAERIAGGEADDIAAVLAAELRAPLRRGRSGWAEGAAHGARRVRRAYRRPRGRDYDEALEHARAVIATLREALPPKELSDLLAQLPRGYQEALLKIYEPRADGPAGAGRGRAAAAGDPAADDLDDVRALVAGELAAARDPVPALEARPAAGRGGVLGDEHRVAAVWRLACRPCGRRRGDAPGDAAPRRVGGPPPSRAARPLRGRGRSAGGNAPGSGGR